MAVGAVTEAASKAGKTADQDTTRDSTTADEPTDTVTVDPIKICNFSVDKEWT